MRRKVRTVLMCLCAGLGTFGLFLPAHAQECFEAPEGLVAWWPADGDTSDIEDGNDGVSSGGMVFASGRAGQAFDLDGIDDFVSVPNAANLNFGTVTTFSVDAWINIEGPSTSTHRIINKGRALAGAGTGTFKGWDVHYDKNSNAIRAVIGDGTTLFCPLDGTTDVADGMWHHVAVVFRRPNTCDTNAFEMYIDGVRETTTVAGPGAASPSSDVSTTSPIHIGTAFSEIEFFEGLIDEVEIFDRALTAAEILALFDAGSAGKCKDEDGDGFRPPEDCDESDPWINPDAVELPGNFVDENCDGSLGDVDPCFAWQNHGKYVRAVAHAVNDLVDAGLITEEEGDALVSSSAQSQIGKTGFVPVECQ